MLVQVEFSDISYLDYPLYGGFAWAPFTIQVPVSDGGGVQNLRRLFQPSGIDDVGEMLLVTFVAVVAVKECRSVRGGFASAGDVPHLNPSHKYYQPEHAPSFGAIPLLVPSLGDLGGGTQSF